MSARKKTGGQALWEAWNPRVLELSRACKKTGRVRGGYDYKRLAVRTPGMPETCISMSRDEYAEVKALMPGKSDFVVSKYIRSVASTLRIRGHLGTLSAATRFAVLHSLQTLQAKPLA